MTFNHDAADNARDGILRRQLSARYGTIGDEHVVRDCGAETCNNVWGMIPVVETRSRRTTPSWSCTSHDLADDANFFEIKRPYAEILKIRSIEIHRRTSSMRGNFFSNEVVETSRTLICLSDCCVGSDRRVSE